MQLFGLIVMTIGSVGIVSSTILEIKTGEEIYGLMMKVFPWVFSLGAVLFFVVGK